MLKMVRHPSNVIDEAVPLAADPDRDVTDGNKREFLLRALEHQLVRTIEQQAKAFREGVEEVTGSGCLGLLSASELKTLWAGQAAHLQPVAR